MHEIQNRSKIEVSTTINKQIPSGASMHDRVSHVEK